MKLLNIGFGNMVNADRIIGIVSPDSCAYQASGAGCPREGRTD